MPDCGGSLIPSLAVLICWKLCCARGDLGQQRREGPRAFGLHSRIGLLAFYEPEVEIQTAADGVCERQLDLSFDQLSDHASACSPNQCCRC
jgi:hypothetical protein